MKCAHRVALLVTTLLMASVAGVAWSDSHMDAAKMSGGKGEMMFWISDAESKLMQLADATPEAKYKWRPAKGVRSTGEVFMHVASANYFAPMFAGITPPASFTGEAYEKSMTKKADIQKALQESFAHMKKGFAEMSDADMDAEVEMFGQKTTKRGVYFLLLSHAHEHLGQSIAYARSNGIAPPWSAAQDAAFRAMQEKKKAEMSK